MLIQSIHLALPGVLLQQGPWARSTCCCQLPGSCRPDGACSSQLGNSSAHPHPSQLSCGSSGFHGELVGKAGGENHSWVVGKDWESSARDRKLWVTAMGTHYRIFWDWSASEWSNLLGKPLWTNCGMCSSSALSSMVPITWGWASLHGPKGTRSTGAHSHCQPALQYCGLCLRHHQLCRGNKSIEGKDFALPWLKRSSCGFFIWARPPCLGHPGRVFPF